MMRARGFTLIELLVALLVFAAIAAIAYGTLNRVVDTRASLAAETSRLGALQFTVGLLERDLRQAARRPVRDGYGQVLPTFVGGRAGVELTAFVPGSVLVDARPLLARLAWVRVDDRLERRAWPVLDRSLQSQPQGRALLEEVEAFTLRYLDRGGRWFDQWPPPGPADDPESLPRAVEFEATVAGIGAVRRVIELPDAPAPADAAP